MTKYKEIRKSLEQSVSYVGNTGRRAFDAVVFELAGIGGEVKRTIVMRTSGTLHRELDVKRTQRMARRLRALGYSKNWDAFRHPQDGVGGTIRMFRA